MQRSFRTIEKLLVSCTALNLAATLLHAAAPVPQEIVVSPAPGGQAVTIYGRATDADNDLHHYIFYYWTPQLTWVAIATVSVGGGNTWAKTDWVPYDSTSSFTVKFEAYDTASNVATSANSAFTAFQGSLVTDKVVASGQIFDVVDIYDIRTKLDPGLAPPVVRIQSGGDSILWSRQRVLLEPGFRADSGSAFWAAVDSNMNGYSDAEESKDSDGDGMFDAWELDHGLNPYLADGGSDLDGDGTSNYNEFLAGRNPNDRADGPQTPPSGFQLVLRIPTTPNASYYGLNTTTWVIGPVSAP